MYGQNKDDSDEFLRVFWLDGTRKYVEDTPWTLLVGIVCLILVILIPLVIIFYPLFAYIYNSNKRTAPKYLSHFYDSLRLCYKDNYIACFFTAVYFLYRIGALAIYAFTTTVHYQYLWQCGFFLSLLLIHCMVQPYSKNIYNIIDGIVFFIMASISLLSLYQLYSVDTGLAATNKAFIFQLILIYLPFVYIVLLWPCMRCYRYLKAKNTKTINADNITCFEKLIKFVDKNLLNVIKNDEGVGQENGHDETEMEREKSTSHCSSKRDNTLKEPLLTTENKT